MRHDLTVEEALEVILEQAPSFCKTEELPLSQAHGRILAQDLAAKVDHPDQDDTSLDGYAARAQDTLTATPETPVRLRVIGEAPAGQPFPGEVGPGEAVWIFTGAPIPKGADAVLRVEDTRREGDTVLFFRPANPGDIRPKGDDFRAGEVLLNKGDLLTPGRLGLCAAMGYPRVAVFARPRVGILTTGDEVVEPGQPLPYGGVYNANNYSLAALVSEAGGEPVLMGKIPDQPERLREKLEGVGGLDLLLTTGGVSMGQYDIVRQLLEREGRIHFWKVRLQPGGPLLFAQWNDLPIFALPGNPVSSMVTFFLFARPYLFKTLSRNDAPYSLLEAVAATPFSPHPSKVAYRRGVLSWGPEGLRVHTTGNQSSGVLRSMALGNALVVLEAGVGAEVGQKVRVIPLGFVL
ncbi:MULTISPECIES: gephyrin-like molybdotransferase Glp [unclassified Meiothermus]|uniref:molybdopterin molybdotransferase MoeA n=1 Tax=unclassified Meiothermus TaxID=370471 RepID=UPI000D7CBEC8|nr:MULTISPECIES: gephyrin-like molybdotransferase Glp [unclassified Meiothermus]PZA08126.1 molybdopterin molybdenumtransferase MoeA [Meiothermus sp. Pnk-1]RYM31384.1 molybdopterin molybdenumtransferase MoeA [Meiothermus sp. PNK-Is4]